MDETSNAIVKAAGDALSDPSVRQFASQITGAPTEEVGEWMAGRIRYARFKSEVKILVKAQRLLEDAGIDPRTVKLNVLVPLLEGAVLEEDDDLVDKWAALLANAATDPDGVPPSYPELLRQLSPLEAKVLDAMFHASYVGGAPLWRTTDVDTGKLGIEIGITGDSLELAVDNLMRMRLCGSLMKHINASQLDNKGALRLTLLGHELVKACQPPKR